MVSKRLIYLARNYAFPYKEEKLIIGRRRIQSYDAAIGRGLGFAGGCGRVVVVSLDARPLLALAVLAFRYALVDRHHVHTAPTPARLTTRRTLDLVAHFFLSLSFSSRIEF